MNQGSPFLRWAGSKRKLVPVLRDYWRSEFRTYFEPFMGSAQLFFALDQAQEGFLSDRNNELVETYLQIQKSPRLVYNHLRGFINSENEYYRVRNADISKLGKNQRAARFIYLNWLCFNGLYRTNNAGKFNVPYSKNHTKKLDNWPILKAASEKLQNIKIEAGDFEDIIRTNVKPNDFVYLDPPYALENQRIFTQYCNYTFGLSDLDRLLELTHFINRKGAFFILSYAHSNEIIQMFDHWSCRKVNVQRNIAGFAEFRRKSDEVIFTNIK
jgi:DNA adenine methylase